MVDWKNYFWAFWKVGKNWSCNMFDVAVDVLSKILEILSILELFKVAKFLL